ncbi:MAG: FISUMP domain-containing protein, partial [Microscillaceae bacterium]|nr:FISUMP domain-containing protein [Microscillaceae bacterium]
DGRVYRVVTIGTQTWLGENLKYETPSAGSSICYDNNDNNCETYGRLYNFEAAEVACPSGWHLASDEEWKTLERFLGIPESELDDLGGRGTDEGAELVNGIFKAEKGGAQSTGGNFTALNVRANFWTSTSDPENNTEVFYRRVDDVGDIFRTTAPKTLKICVRCLKN